MQRIVYAFAPFYFLRQATRHTTLFFFFFFNDTATTEIYTLSLHDALPISARSRVMGPGPPARQQRRRQDDRVDGEDLHPDRKSTRLNSSHVRISYAVFCLKKKKKTSSHSHYNNDQSIS